MNRVESLTQIITFGKYREQAFTELAKFGFVFTDDNDDFVEISDSILAAVLQKFISGCISEDDLEEWANFIECRDDINCEKNEGYIYALANPELMGAITTKNIHKMLAVLTN
ncbi:hypothetical protein [Neptunomonas japonica]|uniref:hypothetical protein n=1 Tax=Neptunomonas japonica TaxID=417574 RepID=UPI0003F52B0B|nr:hypothetical protein [Neptunomonas japonica]